ncbi:MAG: lipoprotein signal peptidase [Bacteroidetes bacterium]|nr:lipoprotein signal peptidase [Bacteroidota bacterium]
MNGKKVAVFIALIIFIDQAIKFYIKLHYFIGEEHTLIGEWARLHFVENEGMAWGLKFGGGFGKIILTLFRLVAVIWGVFLIKGFIEQKYHKGFIICAALIFAGAVGNLIDSLFYGMIFDASYPYTTMVAHLFPRTGGYAPFLHGKVVDMFYFPIIREGHFPKWFPIWGGEEFEFFRPVFNFADAAISTGVIALFVFQKKFFKEPTQALAKEVEDAAN